MNNNLELLIVAVTVVILAEVTYLLAKLPKTSVKAKDRAILVDTSVVMDGRIVGVARSGFIGGTLVIPRSVIGELQFLADNADADKRARARYGLDVVKELQDMDDVKVELLQDGSRTEHGVDERLLELAKQHNAVICTIDYNLNKVAVVEGIKVLNLNELAQGLRMAHLPGEHMRLELVQKGNDSHQAVGYLTDGTMVVVEQSVAMIGQTVEVEVIRSLQTAAGKMMFAKRVGASNQKPQAKKPYVKKTDRPAVAPAIEQPQTVAKPQITTPSQRMNNAQRPRPSLPQQNSQNQKAPNQNQARPRQNQRPRRVDHEANLVNMIEHQQ